MNNNDIPVWEKYTLIIEEASKYINWTQSNANEPCMCYDEHKSYQSSFQQGKEQTPKGKREEKHTETTGTAHAVIERTR